MALNSRFTRPTDDRIIAGVCSGLARQLGLDAGAVRIGFAVLVLLPVLGWWVYPALWLLMPEEGQDRAGINDVVDQAKRFAADTKARRDAATGTPQQPMDVFDPYADDTRR